MKVGDEREINIALSTMDKLMANQKIRRLIEARIAAGMSEQKAKIEVFKEVWEVLKLQSQERVEYFCSRNIWLIARNSLDSRFCNPTLGAVYIEVMELQEKLATLEDSERIKVESRITDLINDFIDQVFPAKQYLEFSSLPAS